MVVGYEYKFKTFCKCSCFPAFYHRVPTVQQRLYQTSATLLNFVCARLCNEHCYWLFSFRCVCIVVKRAYLVHHVRPLICLSPPVSAHLPLDGFSTMFGIGDFMKNQLRKSKFD